MKQGRPSIVADLVVHSSLESALLEASLKRSRTDADDAAPIEQSCMLLQPDLLMMQ